MQPTGRGFNTSQVDGLGMAQPTRLQSPKKNVLMLVVAHCLLGGLPQGWTPIDWIRSEALKSCHAWKMLERGQLLFWM